MLMPAWIEPLLVTTTLVALIALLGVVPRFARASQVYGGIPLGLVALAGGATALSFHQLWLLGAMLLPGLAWLIGMHRRTVWNAWACLYAACLVQQAIATLFSLGWVLLRSSELSLVLRSLAWGRQVLAVVAPFPLTIDVLAVPGRRHFPERDRMLAAPEPSHWPGCLQVPPHNEPPELVARVILQLLRQQ
ncbi:hypothetical protein [Thermogemmatispora tikiterensis]|uniref:Uncharacterized protein n=1 Tax=Thermogemmatispora tikiterensis TaxID=1825093 RepID=A0A328VDM0_9CHLR|nr:hypothetical protein [Thermogemmatispora tikiterensis]RAQ95848.1 hypothetical protein A4R35_09895 [Thermogemmatispora tikiterensis]